jgi:hypothetical protein
MVDMVDMVDMNRNQYIRIEMRNTIRRIYRRKSGLTKKSKIIYKGSMK